MRQKSVAALLLSLVLLLSFAIDWSAIADTELKPRLGRSEENPGIFEAVPRVRRVGALTGTDLGMSCSRCGSTCLPKRSHKPS